jgi:hypothetical protein
MYIKREERGWLREYDRGGRLVQSVPCSTSA